MMTCKRRQSDKRWAAKTDVQAVESGLRLEIAGVTSAIRVLRLWLLVGFVALAVWDKIEVSQLLQLLLRLLAR